MINTNNPPHTIVNPYAQSSRWTGDDWCVVSGHNPNWLNSAWLGTVWNVVCLPQRTWFMLKASFAYLRAGMIGTALLALPLLVLAFFQYLLVGLVGHLRMLPPLPLDLMNSPGTEIAGLEEGEKLISSGFDSVVVRVQK